MNDLVLCDLKPPDVLNSLVLRIISMILGHEPMIPNTMHNSGLSMKLKTSSHEVRALDAIKCSKVWMT